MIVLAIVFAICCLTAQAIPGYHEQGHEQLEGVPGLHDYGKLHYPKFDVLDLGSESKGEVPPKTIHVTKTIKWTVPKPYPVKVPHPVHVPYPVAKPYPVVHTKLVHVPKAYPIEVVKKVAVPVEVPKPYPVPAEEYKPPQHGAPIADYGHSFGGSAQGGDQGHSLQLGGGSSGYGQSFGGSHGGDQGHTLQLAGGDSAGYGHTFGGSIQEGEEGHTQQLGDLSGHSFGGSAQGDEQGHSYGGDFSGHSFGGSAQGSSDQGHLQQLSDSYGVPGQEHGAPLGGADYPSDDNGLLKSYEAHQASSSYGSDGHGESDQSAQYSAVSKPEAESGGWTPLSGGESSSGGGESESQH